jgi:hypothetical protein
MNTTRTSLFFAILALACAVITAATPAEFRGLNYLMVGLALFWSTAFQIEYRLSGWHERRRQQRLAERPPEPQSAFAPPPPPGAEDTR